MAVTVRPSHLLSRQSTRLPPETLGSAYAMGAWTQKLALRRVLRSGKQAAAIMSLIQSARMNGHDPYGYLEDELTRLPTEMAIEIGQLLPHQWVAPSH